MVGSDKIYVIDDGQTEDVTGLLDTLLLPVNQVNNGHELEYHTGTSSDHFEYNAVGNNTTFDLSNTSFDYAEDHFDVVKITHNSGATTFFNPFKFFVLGTQENEWPKVSFLTNPDHYTLNTASGENTELTLNTALSANEELWVIYGTERQFYMGGCLLYTSPSPRDGLLSRMPSSA